MRLPEIYKADVIRNWDCEKELSSGKWVPARPYGHNAFSWLWRWKVTWGVLTGKYDALDWEEEILK